MNNLNWCELDWKTEKQKKVQKSWEMAAARQRDVVNLPKSKKEKTKGKQQYNKMLQA